MSPSDRLHRVYRTLGPDTSPQADIPYLISQLTLDEKASLIAGADLWTTNPVPRLGIPKLKVTDGPNGARGDQFEGGLTSACFPASVSLAASFDRNLAEKIGQSLAEEAKTKGARVLLGPTVCPHRDPRGGRNFESFSEDPYLAGELASHYIMGLQCEGIGATIKHYAVNEQETRRFSIDARVGQRALREIYLKPFEIAIKKADPWAVMTSYNIVNGVHADANQFLLSKVLREEWGFKGLVMSDWGGTNSLSQSVNAGLDLEMPGPPVHRTRHNVTSALQSGEISETTLNKRVEAVLHLLRRAGSFDNHEIPIEQAIDRPEHQRLIRKAGAEGMVLLKNEKKILPLDKSTVKSIAMIGLAKQYLGHGGGSASVKSHRKITPYQAFEDCLGSSVELNYAQGARIIKSLPVFGADNVFDDAGVAGFTLRVTRRSDKDGGPSVSNTSTAQLKPFTFPGAVAAVMTGIYRPSVDCVEYLAFGCIGKAKLCINEETVFSQADDSIDVMAFMLGTAAEETRLYEFSAGQEYRIRIECHVDELAKRDVSPVSSKMIGFRFGKMLQSEHDADLIPAAVDAARRSEVAIVFVGHTPAWETEGADRQTMDLPKNGSLDRLIAATAQANPRTIVVNSTGSPITMPWLSQVAAVLQAWFPGQEAGHSIADVIFGVTNPGGRLPVTFPRSITDCPTYANFPGDINNDRVEYAEGISVGYRHYDSLPDSVLFPFGFGLSYTSFEISGVELSATSLTGVQPLVVTLDVKNTGTVPGSQVVQIYVGAAFVSQIERPNKALAGFDKVHLSPGETQKVQIEISPQSLAYWNQDRGTWSVDAGTYMVSVATSSLNVSVALPVTVVAAFQLEP
ncbi:hypothetical protein B0A52_08141 [Exophiala mesophila]|uniref:beta-glucosidase n=1 Tax=Exophiala mesophila TaxID=212818 RepID=A0A438MV26_EXOME|nr:hypothetical protein B0A52_08141 [Exophiala mesophila]